MSARFRHKSGLVAIPFSDAVWQIQGTAFYIPTDLFVVGGDWKEITNEPSKYPNGTILRHKAFNALITKVGTAPQWRSENGTSFFDFDESLIGSVYELVEFQKEKKPWYITAFKTDTGFTEMLPTSLSYERWLSLHLKNENPILRVLRTRDNLTIKIGDKVTTPFDGLAYNLPAWNIITSISIEGKIPFAFTKYGGFPYTMLQK